MNKTYPEGIRSLEEITAQGPVPVHPQAREDVLNFYEAIRKPEFGPVPADKLGKPAIAGNIEIVPYDPTKHLPAGQNVAKQ